MGWPTDSVVARNPVTSPEQSANVSWPMTARAAAGIPSATRPVNFFLLSHRSTKRSREHLLPANYALRTSAHGVWMSFRRLSITSWANQAVCQTWIVRATKYRFSQTDPAGNRFVVDGNGTFGIRGRGVSWVDSRTATDLDGWQRRGARRCRITPQNWRSSTQSGHSSCAVTSDPGYPNHVLPRQMATHGPGDSPRRSRRREDQYLTFLIAGETHRLRVALRLLADGARGRPFGVATTPTHFELVIYLIARGRGQRSCSWRSSTTRLVTVRASCSIM